MAAAGRRRSRVLVIASVGSGSGWLVLVIGGGMARGPVSIGVFVRCYGVVLILAGTVTWPRTLRPRHRTMSGSHEHGLSRRQLFVS